MDIQLKSGAYNLPKNHADWNACLRLNDFIARFFRDPMDEDKPFNPFPWQTRFFDAIWWNDKSIAVNTPRGFGKTVAIAYAGAALVQIAPYWIGFFSMSQGQSDEIMMYAEYGYETSQYMFKPQIKGKNTNIEKRFSNGGRLFSFPQSEKQVRGKRLHYAFVDEMSRIDDEFIRLVVRPTQRRIGKKFIGVSSPFGMVGEFYRIVHDELNYTVIMPDPLQVYTKEELWKELRNYGVYLDKEVLELTDPEFLQVVEEIEDLAVIQELLAKFIPPGDRAFKHEWLKSAYRSELKLVDKGHPDFNYYLGADFGKMNDRTCFCVGHFFENKFWLDYIESWLEGETKGKEFYPFVRARIHNLCKKFNIRQVIPDGSGVGAPVLDELKQEFKNYSQPPRMYRHKNKNGFIFTEQTKYDLIENLISGFMNDTIRLPYHEGRGELKALENELLSFTYEIYGSRQKKIHYGVQNAHDDRVIAFALMYWGATKGMPWMKGITARGY